MANVRMGESMRVGLAQCYEGWGGGRVPPLHPSPPPPEKDGFTGASMCV